MTQNLTRGGLKAAEIRKKGETTGVRCMFNPFEYTISKSNSWQRGNQTGQDAPRQTFRQGGAQTLQMTLYFDTLGAGTSVRVETEKLFDLMKIDESTVNTDTNKGNPPEVEFVWSDFTFAGFIKTMTQKFTLFTATGTPVRANVQVTFEQILPDEQPPPQEAPTAGTGESAMNNPRGAAEASGSDNPLAM